MAHALQALLTCGFVALATAAAAYEASQANANAAMTSASKSQSGNGEVGYSTNAICMQYNCINPIVPGLTDLTQLEATTWQCQDYNEVKQYASFCKNAIYYTPGVPNPKKSQSLADIVAEQDNAASTMYFYALSGMNMEPWQHRQPWLEQNPCAVSMWKTVCNTYFPRAQAGCTKGKQTLYMRPCKNVCQNYLKACNVECCDESVQCTFNKTVFLQDGKTSHMQGYADELGPSATCTGAAAPGSTTGCLSLLLLAVPLMMWLGVDQ